MNKVIIFGGDHYNALGLVRVFGINGIKPYGILTVGMDGKNKAYASKSKFWKKVWLVKDEEEGLSFLKEFFSHEKEMPVIIPSSDGAELLIDNNLDTLRKKFLLPSINSTQGLIGELMNKTNQNQWANKIGLKTAKSWELNLKELDCERIIEVFPCILKPVLSSEGEKADIIKCLDIDEAKKAIAILKKKGYTRVLAQQFINKEYEVELFGCITQNSKCHPYILSKHVREWPPVAGSVSCHEFLVEDKYKKMAEDILTKIMQIGYTGNIDIELFLVNEEFILNEVNFRNSGDVYACFRNKLFYPLIWYMDIIGLDTKIMNMSYDNEKYAMNETTDFRHVIFGKLSFSEWMKFCCNCGDFALWFMGDMKPTLTRYFQCFVQLFRKGKQQKQLGQE